MDDNLLGRNIKHLRIIHGETLDVLGNTIGFAKSTIKGYESGVRKPDPETLKAIAEHYGKTIDELLHTDLTGLEKISFNLDSPKKVVALQEAMLPLFTHEEYMCDEHFKQGIEYCQHILSAFSKGDTLRGSIIVDVFQEFMVALKQIEKPEVVANIIWSIFIWWSQIIDINQAFAMQNKLLSKKLTYMEMKRAKHNEPVEVKEKKAGFISDFDELLNELIKALKSDEEWSDLADYYLALRYVVGMIDTGYSVEMNMAIGIQMMLSFARCDNKYARSFLKSCSSV